MTSNRLVGTWGLVTWELRTEDADVTFPFGENAIGYLLYNEDGYMSVTIMKPNRRTYASGELMGGTMEERAEAAGTYHSYCGRYEIREDRLIHHVDISLFPNRVGEDQVRMMEIEGDKLILRTPPFLAGGKWRTARVVWKRMKGHC